MNIQSKGERYVVIGHMPEDKYGDYNEEVYSLKHIGAQIINQIDSIEGDNGDVPRWKATAITHIETGIMYAVKAAVHAE